MTQKKIGCIFDLDGVLFLSNEIHHQAFREALTSETVEVFDYRELAGMITENAIQKIFRNSGKTLSLEKLRRLASLKRKYASEMLDKIRPVAPYCKEVITEFHRRGILLALASSSSSKNVKLFLDSSGTREFFSVVLSGEDVKKSKPDPEIFYKARVSLGLPPELCFVVEDSESGIRGALSDGMNVIGILGTHTQKEFESFGVETVISNLDELLKLVQFKTSINNIVGNLSSLKNF